MSDSLIHCFTILFLDYLNLYDLTDLNDKRNVSSSMREKAKLLK